MADSWVRAVFDYASIKRELDALQSARDDQVPPNTRTRTHARTRMCACACARTLSISMQNRTNVHFAVCINHRVPSITSCAVPRQERERAAAVELEANRRQYRAPPSHGRTVAAAPDRSNELRLCIDDLLPPG